MHPPSKQGIGSRGEEAAAKSPPSSQPVPALIPRHPHWVSDMGQLGELLPDRGGWGAAGRGSPSTKCSRPEEGELTAQPQHPSPSRLSPPP